MNLDFTFEESPWQLFSRRLKRGDTVDALHFLNLMEGESEESLSDALDFIHAKRIQLDISRLPAPEYAGELGKRLAWEKKVCEQGDLLANLEENDPLRPYLEDIAATPACGDMEMLAMELTEDISQARRETVQNMLSNLCLSRLVASAKAQAGNRVLLVDMIQDGFMGLWSAILEYDGSEPFEPYAQALMDAAIAQSIIMQARENGVGQKMRGLCDDYRAADKALLARLGRNPSLEEIAMELNITPDEAFQVQSLVQSAAQLAKARRAGAPREEIPEEEDQAVENTAYYQSRQRVNEMLEGLDETQAKLISLRFGLEGGLPLSAQEVGKMLNMTAEEVVAMEAAALQEIRKKV